MRQIHHWAALLFVASHRPAHAAHLLHRRVPQAARAQLGRSASCCSSSRWPRASPATRSPTTCSRATACASSTAWSRASRSSAPGPRSCSSAASSPATRSSAASTRCTSCCCPRSSSPCIGVHLMLLVINKHTQFAGPGRTERATSSAARSCRCFAAKAGGFFFIIFGVIVLIAATVHDQPDLELRPVRPVPGLGRNAARLVHRLRRRRAAPRPAGLGVRALRPHAGRSTSSSRCVVLGLFLVARRDLPVHRGVGHRRQARAPHRRPSAQRARRAPRSAPPASRSTRSCGRRRAPTSSRRTSGSRWRASSTPSRRCCSSARSSPTSSPSASASRCRRRTARSRCTATSPAASSASPAASTSRCTSRVDEYERWKLVDFDDYEPLMRAPERARAASRSTSASAPCVSRWFFEDRIAPVTKTEIEAAREHGHH